MGSQRLERHAERAARLGGSGAGESASIPPVQTAVNKLADGVWHIMGGRITAWSWSSRPHCGDRAPLTEERFAGRLAEAKKLVPNKPIRYCCHPSPFRSHGRSAQYVAEGATIIHASIQRALLREDAVAPPRHARHAGEESENADVPGRLRQVRADRRQAAIEV